MNVCASWTCLLGPLELGLQMLRAFGIKLGSSARAQSVLLSYLSNPQTFLGKQMHLFYTHPSLKQKVHKITTSPQLIYLYIYACIIFYFTLKKH